MDVINTAKVSYETECVELNICLYNLKQYDLEFSPNIQDIARGGEYLNKIARQIADAVSSACPHSSETNVCDNCN